MRSGFEVFFAGFASLRAESDFVVDGGGGLVRKCRPGGIVDGIS